MKRLVCDIIIGNYRLDYVTNIEVVSSWQELTDTAKITLPRKFVRDGDTIIGGNDNIFKRGDQVTLRFGWFPNKPIEFVGYISDVVPNDNLEITVQDAMYLLKQKTITKSFRNVTLDELLTEVVPESVPVTAVDANLGKFRITKANIVQVLNELKKTYGLVSFIRDGALFSGLAYYPEQAVDHVFDFQNNVIDGSSLVYKREDDIKFKVQAISMLPNNTKIEIEVGDPDGDQRTLFFYDVPESQLRQTAEAEIEKLKFEGYTGSFTTFGEPSVKHGDRAVLIDRRNPEREGTYLIKKVTKTFGVSGYFQTIELDTKVS